MKHTVFLAAASFAFVASAAAQVPTAGPAPGPHDPNPPMNAPDLRLPPPCAPTPNLAATGGIVRPGEASAKAAVGTGATPVESDNAIQCSSNAVTQSAALPGLISPEAVQ